MEAFGKKDESEIDKLLNAAAAMQAANLAVPPEIIEKLGAGFADKSPKELALFPIPQAAMKPYPLGALEGLEIDLSALPEGLQTLIVLPRPFVSAASAPKPESTSSEPTEPSKVVPGDDEPQGKIDPRPNEAIDELTDGPVS